MNEQSTRAEIELRLVAETDRTEHGIRSRLVLKDQDGANRAVLAVGGWQRDLKSAISSMFRVFERVAPRIHLVGRSPDNDNA